MNTIVMSLALLCVGSPPIQTAAEPESLLYVHTTPAGAQILLDGKPLGTSDGLFPVEPGAYKIVIDLQGHEPKQQQITVRDGRVTRIELQLDKRPATKPASKRSRPSPRQAPEDRAFGQENDTVRPAIGQETVGPWTDLLKPVDFARDVIRGQWKRNQEAIVVTPTEAARQHLRLRLPVTVTGGYDLEMEFTRSEGDETVGAVLPVGTHECVLHLSAFAGRVSGLDVVDGRGIGTPGKSDDSWPDTLTNGRRYKLLVRVRLQGENATVDAILDDKPCVQWSGMQSTLSVWPGWALKDIGQLGLAVNESTVTFHTVKIRPVNGRVEPLAATTRWREGIPLDQWIDLLARVDLPADSVRGTWVRDGEALVASPPKSDGTCAMLMLPVEFEGSYDLDLEFTRINHDDSVILGLPAGSRACTFHLSAWSGNVGGLEMIDGMAVGMVGNPAVIRPNALTNGRRYRVLAKVRTTGDDVSIEVLADGQPHIEWKGKQSSLGTWGSWNDMNPKRPALGSNENIVRFHWAKLRLISGTGTMFGVADDQPSNESQ